MSRLMLKQEYPPTKVQPQPSATRDDGTISRLHCPPVEYDKIDAEASSILIALANQEPQRIKTQVTKVNDNKTDQDGDVVMMNNDNTNINNNIKSIRDGNNDMQNVVNNTGDNGHHSSSSSMSISSLLGGGSSSTSSTRHENNAVALTSDPSYNRSTQDQEQRKTTKATTEQNVVSDPIMLLAAAAAAIDGRMDESTAIYSVDRQETKRNTSTPSGSNNGYYSQHYSSAEIPNNHIKQKPVKSSSHATYYQKDDHRYISKSSIKTRHHPHDQHSSDMDPSNGISGRYYTNNNDELSSGGQHEGTNVFSYQYMSMKQNPRIKRNAMHAYITYMIYTDIAQRDRMKPTEKIINPSSNGQANYGDEQNTITNGYDRTRKNEMNGRFEYINNNGNKNSNNGRHRREITCYTSSRSSEQYQHRNNSNDNNNNQISSTVVGGLVHSADDHYHQQQRQQHNNNNSQRPQHHHRHSIGSEPSSLWYTPTSTSLPTHTSSSNSAPFPTTSSSSPHYHLPSSSPSTPQPPSTSNNNNSTSHPIETTRSSPSPISFNSSSGNNNNPLMMGRPLTAFLRDAPSSEQQHHHHHHHHSKDNNHSTNNNSTSRRPHPFSTFSSTSHGSSTSNHKGRHPLL